MLLLQYDSINYMSILNCAYCEPLPLDGFNFGADFVFRVDWESVYC
jgi:hypothetical protein